jgi:molybdopterin-guanine dinucleotide biosynthesis protein B
MTTPAEPPISSPNDAPHQPPIVSFVGYSGSGKTTFLEKLIPVLTAQGIKIAVVKHDAHGFQMDKPGKDTWRHKQAGASATVIISKHQIGLVMDVDQEPTPHELAGLLNFAHLIITEGYKHGPYLKIEIFRPQATANKIPIGQNDSTVLAMVSDARTMLAIPHFDLEDAAGVARFLIDHFQLPAIK